MRVAVLGDSWALKGEPAMREVLEPLNFNMSVSFARGGALACMLAHQPDCLHPNQDGMRILMRTMAERYFQKRRP